MYSLKRSHIAAFLLASSAAFGIAPAANAQGMPGHGMHRGGPMMMLRGLDLTQAQRDQVFQIFHDQARAQQAPDVQAKALSNLALLRAQTINRVRAILTPEQRSRLDQRAQRHHSQG